MGNRGLVRAYAVIACLIGIILLLRVGGRAQNQKFDWDSVFKAAEAYFALPTQENARKLYITLPEFPVPLAARDKHFSEVGHYLYDHLYDLEKLMQADKIAVEIAFRLYNVSDGGFTEELYNSIGDLADTNPSLFLEELKNNPERFDAVCCGKRINGFYAEDKKSEHDELLAKRIKALESVKDEALVPLKEKCIEQIKKCFLKQMKAFRLG
jgi:hypothetical protein